MEELETSNEELQATNEELFAANEELQSTNEELHSVNEELITVNAEYHAKIQELTKLNEDINNLLSSTNVGTIFLDRDLKIRLFTPAVQREIHLLDQDLGRPINHVTHKIINCDLVHESRLVLATLTSREMEVRNEDGLWYQVKFAPYYTMNRQIGGVVISLLDVTTFKNTNAQLAKLSAAVEQSPSSVIITDLMGGIEYVNPRFTSVTGYTIEEVLGKNPRILSTGQTPKETYRQLWDTITSGEEWRGEFVNRKKNGEEFYEFASISPIFDENKKAIHYLAIKQDITNHKKVDQALHESESRYRLLISSLPDLAILLFDRDFRFLVAGGGELERSGFEKDKVEGRTLAEAFPPEVVENFLPKYQKALEGESSSFEYIFNDQSYHLVIAPVRNEHGEPYAGMVLSHNITPRVEMEKSLRLNLDKYHALFDLFPFGLTIADKSGKIFESNRKAELILGITKEEHKARAIDSSEWKIIRPDGSLMPADEYASVRALKENHLIENVEMGIVKSKDNTAWISVTATPIGDYGVVVTYTEIDQPRTDKKNKKSPPKSSRL